MIVTEDIFSTVSQLSKPLYGVFITGVLSVIIKLYDNYHDKNAHIKFLRLNFPIVNLFIERIQNFKMSTIISSFFSLFLGILIGVAIGILFSLALEAIFIHVLDIKYVQNLLYPTPSDQNLAVLQLNLQIFYSSCLNIISFFFLLFIDLMFYIKSRKLLIPVLIADDFLKPSVYYVHIVYSVFLGIPVGMLLLFYPLLFSNLQTSSLIEGNFSFTSIYLTGIIESLKTNVAYFEIHALCHFLGFIIGLLIVIDSYNQITNISNQVIKAITNFYICDFPYIKITTNNGETKGKLKDVKNKSFVTLSENNVLKTVKWNKIEILEIKNIKKSEQFIFDGNYEKDNH